MDNILQGIPGVVVYLDNILVTAPTVEEHLKSLETVLDRLLKAGLHIKRNKCTFDCEFSGLVLVMLSPTSQFS